MLGKRKDGLDDTQSLVEIIDSNLADMDNAIAAGDHAAVDRIYNRMVLIMEAAALARAADPDTFDDLMLPSGMDNAAAAGEQLAEMILVLESHHAAVDRIYGA